MKGCGFVELLEEEVDGLVRERGEIVYEGVGMGVGYVMVGDELWREVDGVVGNIVGMWGSGYDGGEVVFEESVWCCGIEIVWDKCKF